MADIVIVGGGVIGCATAFYLSREGAGVTLLERGEIGSEASGAAAGMLAALSDEGGDRGPEFQALCLDSLDLYPSLIEQLQPTGIDLRYRRSGVLHLALDEAEAEELRRRYEEQQKLAPDNRWLQADEIAALEPEASPRAVAGLFSPREHYLDPLRLAQALAAAAQAHGATIRPLTPATGLVRGQGRLRGVRTPHGTIEADNVLLAGGPWTAQLASRLGCQVPVRPVRGQMLSLRGPQRPLGQIIWGRHAYLVPREDGQTFVGATMEDVGFRKRTTSAAIARLRRAAAALAPGLADAPLVQSWAGLRPASPDGLPIMGKLPGWDNAWVATGHFRNGILLTPISGRLMASSILAGRAAPRLSPFSPARFVS